MPLFMKGLPGLESCSTQLPAEPSRPWWGTDCAGGGVTTVSEVAPCPDIALSFGAVQSNHLNHCALLSWFLRRRISCATITKVDPGSIENWVKFNALT